MESLQRQRRVGCMPALLPPSHVATFTLSPQLCLLAVFVCSTALAVAGPDYAIVCGDTRMSDGYTILSREQPKIYQLSAPAAYIHNP